jgi:hypothetical protein
MKVLTATSRTQGERSGDYCFCVEGELVTLPQVICARDARNPDGGCGCGRGWIRSGLTQHDWPDVGAASVAAESADLASDHPIGTVLGHRLGESYARGDHESR